MKLGRSVGVLVLLLSACTSLPLETVYTTEQLTEMLAKPAPCPQEYGLGGWRTDPEKCARDRADQQARVRSALARQHAARLAAAPSCLKSYPVAPESLRRFGIDPNFKDANAELTLRGIYIASLGGSDCAPAVCAWLTEADPAHKCPFCSSAL